MATAVNAATGEQTVRGLKEWFSVLAIPECFQSDNGSRFTATTVKDWARGEGIRWVLHTPYYPQANGVVERTNGLIKKRADVSRHNWDARLPQAVFIVNNRWGSYGNPKIPAFCPTEPLTSDITLADNQRSRLPTEIQAGQPVMLKLPSVGIVPMTLTKPRGLHAWKALDSNGKGHRISARWRIPHFGDPVRRPDGHFVFSCRTMQQQTIWTVLLTAATTAGMDNKNLDGNVVAQLIVGFARKVNLTSITACLPTPKSVEDPLPIFVQNLNISPTLELARQQRNNHSWAWGTDGKDGGHTHILYSWSPGVINANSIRKAKWNYLFLPPAKATGWSFNGTMPCFHVPWGITEPNDQWETDGHSLQYTEPLNATWCIKHPEHNGSDCPNTSQEPGFKGAWEKCPLNCPWGPDWIGQRKGAPPGKTSPLWNCQTEIQGKNIENMPLLWLYPPIREALVQGCLRSNTS